MRRREFLSQLAGWGWAVGTIGLSGCGTVFYHERVGQPHSRDIDWRVVALNGLGLVFFFVPGVIAFAVDFSTGAIYLPPEYADNYSEGPVPSQQQMQVSQRPTVATKSVLPPADWQGVRSSELRRVMIPRNELQPVHIEQVVSRHVGRPMSLLDDNTRVSDLPQLDRFAERWRHHRVDDRFGTTARAFFAPFGKV